MAKLATLPQGNQELLVVKDKVVRPSDEFGVSKSMECDIVPFSALTLSVGQQEGTCSSCCHHHFHYPLLQ